MAKKRQSTGVPGSSEQTDPAVGTTPASKYPRASRTPVTSRAEQYRTRAEREAKLQRQILVGTAAAAAVILVLVLIALAYEVLYRPTQAVARVGDENITVAEFQQRVRLEHELQTIQLSNAINQYSSFMGGDINQAYSQLVSQPPYSTWANELQFPDTLANRVLNDLIDDQLIEAEAAELGITVSDEEVQNQINKYIGYDPEEVALIGTDPTATPSPTVSPTPLVSPTPSAVPTTDPAAVVTTEEAVVTDENTGTEEATGTEEIAATAETAATDEAVATSDLGITAVPTEVTPTLSATEVQGNFLTRRDEFLNRLRSNAQVNDDAINAFFRAQLLREKVGQTIAAQNLGEGGTAPYVNARHILVETEEEAQDVLTALQAGESFASLAQAVSTDTGSGAQGGELDWSPTFQFVAPFAEAVETAPIGEIVGPIESEFGYHIIQVRAREQRPVEEAQLDQIYSRDAEQWIETEREANPTGFETFSVWTDNVPNLTLRYDPF